MEVHGKERMAVFGTLPQFSIAAGRDRQRDPKERKKGLVVVRSLEEEPSSLQDSGSGHAGGWMGGVLIRYGYYAVAGSLLELINYLPNFL